MPRVLASALVNAIYDSDSGTGFSAAADDDIEAMFESGLFDFAWHMLFRNKDFGHYILADGQYPPPKALIVVITRVATLPAATLGRDFTLERVARALAAPLLWTLERGRGVHARRRARALHGGLARARGAAAKAQRARQAGTAARAESQAALRATDRDRGACSV